MVKTVMARFEYCDKFSRHEADIYQEKYLSQVAMKVNRVIKLREKIQYLLKAYIDNLSIHGASKILKGSLLERLVWAVILIGALVYFFINANQLLRKVISNETMTNNEISQVDDIKIPSVTVCDTKSFECSSKYKRCEERDIRQMVDNFHKNISCWKIDGYTQEQCNFKVSSYHLGCFTLNPTQSITQMSPGRNSKTRFLLKPTDGAGVFVFVHDVDQVPSWMDRYQYKTYAAGYHDIVVSRRDIQRLPAPYHSNCSTPVVDTSGVFPYSKSLCHQTCIARVMFSECNTVSEHWWQYLPSSLQPDTDSINNNNKSNSTHSTLKSIGKDDGNLEFQAAQKCIDNILYNFNNHCVCPTPCKETIYGAKIVHTSTTTDGFLYMTIYFGKLEISKTTEQPAYDHTRFIADIGGLIGLLVGMSAISVFEVCACVCLYVIDRILMVVLKFY